MDGWKRFFTYAWPAGILQKIHEANEDINLYIFNSSGDWSWDANYNAGEYNIYNLPDFNDFDGIIIDPNNIRYPEIVDEIAEIVRTTKKPAISISNKLPGFYYVGIDNRKSMITIMEHLYSTHGCRRFWFIMGPKSNYENNIRTDALKEFMQSHQLVYKESDFYFESYEYTCGYRGFTYLVSRLGEGEKLPDAIVCASDNIAVGVMEAAGKMGYRIPEAFCVTGFDNFGHDHGDNAIRIIAATILQYCGKNDIPVRNGGDEFIIVRENMTSASYEEMILNMRNTVAKKSRQLQLPFDLTFSVGSVCTDMTSDMTLDDYIRIADETMYEEKTRKKANRV